VSSPAVTTAPRWAGRRAALVLSPRPVRMEAMAREAGLHPDLVGRLVRLGLVEPSGGTPSAPLFPPDAASRLARAARLRRDLALSYAGAILACDLLARIDELEERLARSEQRPERTR
jgi:chaperone modulatory protein CbpM